MKPLICPIRTLATNQLGGRAPVNTLTVADAAMELYKCVKAGDWTGSRSASQPIVDYRGLPGSLVLLLSVQLQPSAKVANQ